MTIPSRLTLLRESNRRGYGWYRCSCPAATEKEMSIVARTLAQNLEQAVATERKPGGG